MKLSRLEAAVEAILFASGEAVSLNHLSLGIGQDIRTTKEVILSLMLKLQQDNRGIEIIGINDSFQMRTSPNYYENIKILYQNPQKIKLTQPLIETLAIIAYKQPVTKSEIEEIRGVSADHAVNKLMEYGLVCEKGRLDVPGKPILFGTTDDFLKHYGFSEISALPKLPEANVQFQVEAENEADKLLGK